MNGDNGNIDLKELSIEAIITLDEKGRFLIPYKIRKKRTKKFGLFVTKNALILQDLK